MTEAPAVLIAHKVDLKKSLLTAAQLEHYCAAAGVAFWVRTTLADPATVHRALARLCDRALAHQLACERARARARALRERERPARIRIDPALLGRPPAAGSRATADSPVSVSGGVPAAAARWRAQRQGPPVGGKDCGQDGESATGSETGTERATETPEKERSISEEGEVAAKQVEAEYEQLHGDLAYVLGHPCMAPELRQHVAALDAQRAAEGARLAAALRGARDGPALARARDQHCRAAAQWRRLVRQLVDELGAAAVSPAATPPLPPPGPVGRAGAEAHSLSPARSPARSPASLPVGVPGAAAGEGAPAASSAAQPPRRMGFAFRRRAAGSATPSPGLHTPRDPLFPASPGARGPDAGNDIV